MLCSISSAHAEAVAINCPDSIDVASQNLDKKIEGWRYFSDPDAQHTLENVNIFKGRKVVTRHAPAKGTESYEQWRLEDNGKEQYFLICGYNRTAIFLKKLLDPKFTSCKASFGQDQKRPEGSPPLYKITCE